MKGKSENSIIRYFKDLIEAKYDISVEPQGIKVENRAVVYRQPLAFSKLRIRLSIPELKREVCQLLLRKIYLALMSKREFPQFIYVYEERKEPEIRSYDPIELLDSAKEPEDLEKFYNRVRQLPSGYTLKIGMRGNPSEGVVNFDDIHTISCSDDLPCLTAEQFDKLRRDRSDGTDDVLKRGEILDLSDFELSAEEEFYQEPKEV